jgi:hypothetical protein
MKAAETGCAGVARRRIHGAIINEMTTIMNEPLQLDTLGTMHDEIRHKQQVVEMSWRVRDGLFWTHDVLRAYADKHHTPVRPLIAIARFPEGRMMIRDGHHRCLATYIGGRGYLRHDEYRLEEYTYEMYAEINFEVGFVTPFDPRTEVRVSDFTEFRQEVFHLYARNPAEAIMFIRQNKSRYARPRRYNNLAQLAEHWRQKAIAAGIARGDLVADMAILGVSNYTIKLLEASRWNILSLQQLLERTKEELLQIDELEQTAYGEIRRALQRYHELDVLRTHHTPNGPPRFM